MSELGEPAFCREGAVFRVVDFRLRSANSAASPTIQPQKRAKSSRSLHVARDSAETLFSPAVHICRTNPAGAVASALPDLDHGVAQDSGSIAAPDRGTVELFWRRFAM